LIPSPKFSGYPEIVRYLGTLVDYLRRELAKRPPANTAVDSVLLVSPNRSVYTVRVTDTGTLETTLEYETPP
jgi:hypothetical protein